MISQRYLTMHGRPRESLLLPKLFVVQRNSWKESV
jgi:hypothetical protein